MAKLSKRQREVLNLIKEEGGETWLPGAHTDVAEHLFTKGYLDQTGENRWKIRDKVSAEYRPLYNDFMVFHMGFDPFDGKNFCFLRYDRGKYGWPLIVKAMYKAMKNYLGDNYSRRDIRVDGDAYWETEKISIVRFEFDGEDFKQISNSNSK